MGRIFIDDVDVARLNPDELAWLRCSKIGCIFQSYNLIPSMSALENIMTPLVFGGITNDGAMARAEEALQMVGLGDRIFHKLYELSVGQQQRVAIARAFAPRPAIIVADEPTGNLDAKTAEDIIETLGRMNKSEGVTVITATHDCKMISASDRGVLSSTEPLNVFRIETSLTLRWEASRRCSPINARYTSHTPRSQSCSRVRYEHRGDRPRAIRSRTGELV